MSGDPLSVLGILLPAHSVDIAAGGSVLGEIGLRVVAGLGRNVVKADGLGAIAVGVDVLSVAVLDGLLAGPLPPTAGQGDAKRAGVPVGDPGELRPIPQRVFQRGIRPSLLHQAADAAPQQRGAV